MSNWTRPQAILFDLDETLSDRIAAFDAFTDLLIDRYPDLLARGSREELKRLLRDADRHGYRSKTEVFDEFVQKSGWTQPPSAEEYVAFWRSVFPGCSLPMPHMLETLHYFREAGVRLGMITNGSSLVQNGKIEQLGIRSLFDVIVVSGEEGIQKPDPSIFRLTLDRLGAASQAAWFVGDHPVNDIAGARSAGLTAIWFEGEEAWPANMSVQPDHGIRSLAEIVDLYRKAGPATA